MTKESPYSDQPDQPLAPREGADSKYLIVYPMWKKREWYRLSAEERMRVMRDHIAVARRFTGIETNTAYSFGLDDQEFVVAFDADDPSEFLDLVQELRSTESSAYTASETPIFTCIRLSRRARPRRARRRARERQRAGVGASFEASSRSSKLHSFTRGRPCGSPASLLGRVDRLPAGVATRRRAGALRSGRRASRGRGRPAPAGGPRRDPRARMSTVSWASRLLVPMMPVGPRLIQPTTYSPGSGAVVTEDAAAVVRDHRAALVEGEALERRPAVADRAEHEPALDLLGASGPGSGAARRRR